MPKFLSQDNFEFPSANTADEHGIVAIGGDLCLNRLQKAYSAGIFPWPHDGLPLLWFSPDPRFALKPHEIIINRSLKKALRQTSLTIKADTDFLAVIKHCQAILRPHQDGTWITDGIVKAYYDLHKNGLAHSIEAYLENKLVGGLYGVSLGRMFFGESMFFLEENASKICFVTLAAHLTLWNFSLIDCQAHTHTLEGFGAKPLPRSQFLQLIEQNKQLAHKLGPWQLSLSAGEALTLLSTARQ